VKVLKRLKNSEIIPSSQVADPLNLGQGKVLHRSASYRDCPSSI
jgi:hypothetical protein